MLSPEPELSSNKEVEEVKPLLYRATLVLKINIDSKELLSKSKQYDIRQPPILLKNKIQQAVNKLIDIWKLDYLTATRVLKGRHKVTVQYNTVHNIQKEVLVTIKD